MVLFERNKTLVEKVFKTAEGESIFDDIELSAAPSSFTFPAITEIACVRKAGSICHTNLDCGPNKHHKAVAETFGIDKFGGTYAEKLILGRGPNLWASTKPSIFKRGKIKNLLSKK